MGNVRGNYYSRNHTQYAKTECFWDLTWSWTWSWPEFVYTCPTNITDPEKFWAFSFDEMGKYDLPAMLERIKKVTGRKRSITLATPKAAWSFFQLWRNWAKILIEK